MLQVSIQRLDRLLVGLIGLDVLVELLHIRIEPRRIERGLRKPHRAQSAQHQLDEHRKNGGTEERSGKGCQKYGFVRQGRMSAGSRTEGIWKFGRV